MKKKLASLATCLLLSSTLNVSAADQTLERLKNYSPDFTYKDLAKPMSKATIEAGLQRHDRALF